MQIDLEKAALVLGGVLRERGFGFDYDNLGEALLIESQLYHMTLGTTLLSIFVHREGLLGICFSFGEIDRTDDVLSMLADCGTATDGPLRVSINPEGILTVDYTVLMAAEDTLGRNLELALKELSSDRFCKAFTPLANLASKD